MGAVVGFMIPGVLFSIMGPFMEAGEDELFSFRGLLAGLSNIGLGGSSAFNGIVVLASHFLQARFNSSAL